MRVHFRPDVGHNGRPTSTGFYRSVLPAKALNAIGHDAFWRRSVDVMHLETDEAEVMVKIDEDTDVFVFQRPLEEIDLALIKLPFDGLKVIEVDDDLINLQDWSPLLEIYKEQDFAPLNRFIEMLGHADMMTVTTPELAQLYLPYCENMAVLPNHIEFPMWEMAMARGQKPKKPGRVSVGWAGWKHGYDLDILQGVIDKIVNRRNDVDFSIVGWPEAAEKFKCPVTAYPWMNLTQYRPIVASFDIGLAPLWEERFNFGKSWLKALEYMACGVVPIASRWHPDYSRLIVHGHNGLLAETKSEWREAIEGLIGDSDFRNELRHNAIATARKYDNATHAGRMWEAAYRR